MTIKCNVKYSLKKSNLHLYLYFSSSPLKKKKKRSTAPSQSVEVLMDGFDYLTKEAQENPTVLKLNMKTALTTSF